MVLAELWRSEFIRLLLLSLLHLSLSLKWLESRRGFRW